jgi:hypothetical protein
MKLKWLIKELQKLEKQVGGDAIVMAYDEFRADYMRAIEQVCRLEKPTCLCTIYNANMTQDVALPIQAAVAVLNDKIYSVANERHLAVIDLRRICNRPEDYANPIEPSDIGGMKIASAILDRVKTRTDL